jgi:hypothetical protein
LIDMRYHVISLVAVFLALGIGILLGTTLVERGLIAEQKAQIRSLKATFDEIKTKNTSLNSELEAYKRFADESRPYLVANMLPGKTYAVLTGEDPDEGTLSRINDGIAAAGGSVPVTITIASSKKFADPSVIANLATLFTMAPSQQDLENRVFAEIMNQLRTAENMGILTTMDKLGVIHMRGSLTAPVAGAILNGPVDTGALDKTDAPLIDTFVSTAFPMVGVCGSNAQDSVLLLYKKHGISIVDHVDTVPGQVALDMSLAGKPGHYGSGSAANRMLPPP